jgi:hypothetical protein
MLWLSNKLCAGADGDAPLIEQQMLYSFVNLFCAGADGDAPMLQQMIEYN